MRPHIEGYVSSRRAMQLLNISRNYFYHLVKQGEFGEVLRLGKEGDKFAPIRVSVKSYLALCERRKVKPCEIDWTEVENEAGNH